jgi:hypothetical protein
MAFPFLLFAVLEAGLRVALPQPPRGFSDRLFAKRDGYTVLAKGMRGSHYGREFSVEVAANADGYRQGTWADRPVAGKVVWLFGDSFAFGWGVEARESFAAKLNRAGFSVYDLGMPGDGWSQYAARLEWAKKHLPSPDMILIVTYDNDFVDAQNAFTQEASVSRIANVRSWLLSSHVVRLVGRLCDIGGLSNSLANRMGSDKLITAVYRQDLRVHEKSFFDSAQWQHLSAKMRQCLKAAKAVCDTGLVVRIKPAYCNGRSWQETAVQAVGKPKNLYDFQKLDDVLQAVCRQFSLPYATFSAKTDSETDDFYYRHDMHLTARGHAAFAAQLTETLKRLLPR